VEVARGTGEICVSAAPGNPLRRLAALGQSVWLDYIERALLAGGGLERLIREDGISGVTSNPAIFEQAIAQHAEYDAAIAVLARRGASATEIYEALAVEDVCRAADLLGGVYVASGGRDGYVSLEVSPLLAHDTEATVAEAQRLWARVARPNLMIKVPATRAGLTAVEELIGAGINVNVTLLFGVARYREVMEANLAGLERRAATGKSLDRVASVASFFLSRIDSLVDPVLDRHPAREAARGLRGQAAVASARMAYQHFQGCLASSRWQRLAARGARPQRLLWASTSTKDPAYSDVKYVEALIGPDTVNTLPPETVSAYREHGNPSRRLEEEPDAARALPGQLAALGIELDVVSEELERQGVQKFIEPYERLRAMLTRRARELAA
jgi:transaldolase